jgi:ubiquinone/menaquinone biosynthesis C-methylase UbiE
MRRLSVDLIARARRQMPDKRAGDVHCGTWEGSSFFNLPPSKLSVLVERLSISGLLSGKGSAPGLAEADVASTQERDTPLRAKGLVLHAAGRYDLLVWLMTLGRERAFRDGILRLARLRPGESVLDVGCGTGSLAIAAKRQVGPAGAVCGLDASPEMLARAEKKAQRAGLKVHFDRGAAEALPFADGQFDAVLSTMMLHHLPRKSREQCAREVHRVLKTGGRMLAVDFAASERKPQTFLEGFHRHGHVDLPDMIALIGKAGLDIIEQGAVGFRDLQFVLATTGGSKP